MSRPIEITGRTFGRITVLSRAGSNDRGRSTWLCKCECGNRVIILGNHLLSGNSNSCGCGQKDAAALTRMLSTTHGRTGCYYYGSWNKMISRCYNVKDKNFHYYGERGIQVCMFLRQHPDNLIAVIGHRPPKGEHGKYSIDRTDNFGHYSCGTCEECLSRGWTSNLRWATPKEQAANRRPPRKRKSK